MNDLVVVEKIAQWQRLKALVLDSFSSPKTKRVYSMALDEFLAWFRQEPRPGGFSKATVSAWRASLEARGLGSSSIILAVLLACGLRRSEVAALTFTYLQLRDDRWCIVDRQARVACVLRPCRPG